MTRDWDESHFAGLQEFLQLHRIMRRWNMVLRLSSFFIYFSARALKKVSFRERLSKPSAAEMSACRLVNVPSRLLDSLDLHRIEHESDALLIHLSTDQVYDGTKAYWKESDRCKPVNQYGAGKKEAELLIQACTTHHRLIHTHSAHTIYKTTTAYAMSLQGSWLFYVEYVVKWAKVRILVSLTAFSSRITHLGRIWLQNTCQRKTS